MEAVDIRRCDGGEWPQLVAALRTWQGGGLKGAPIIWVVLPWLVSSHVYGAILSFKGQPVQWVEASDQKIPVYSEVSLDVASTPRPPVLKLYLTGAGVRVKKVVLLRVKAYVATSYVENPSLVRRETPLEGLGKNRVKAIQLTFVRNVDAGKIRSSFKDSLEANGVDISNPVIQKVFNQLTFDMPEKSTMTLVGFQKDPKTDILVFEVPNGTFVTEGEHLVSTFWKIWFGEPADGGIAELKQELLTRVGEHSKSGTIDTVK